TRKDSRCIRWKPRCVFLIYRRGMRASDLSPFELLGECLVLDLSQYIPGPYAALTLSDLGAQVIKIEPPNGDPMRDWGPRASDGISVFYKVLNAGKTVIRTDLK